MLALGANLGQAAYGKRLYDGGACIANESGVVCAIAEERLTRIKHCGGYSRSVQYCLGEAGIGLSDLDSIVLSSCVEPLRDIDHSLGFPDSVLDRVQVISHHLSHAYSAFWVSPFDEAIVMVIDAGGNLLEPLHSERWWEHSREQHTYYVGRGNCVNILERQFHKPYEVGFGEAYRCFTIYLGFESDFNAGKLMALAACGNKHAFPNVELFSSKQGGIRCLMHNFPPRVADMVHDWATEQQADLPPQRVPTEPVTQVHADLARFVQTEFEEAFLQEVRRLHSQTGIPNLCIAGGVGLNCVVHNRILRETPIENAFVQPAAGDTGQCLGNALWGIRTLVPSCRRRKSKFQIYLGRAYDLEHETVASLSHSDSLSIETPEDLLGEVVHLLSQGDIVGWFQGRSELGPRALGNRSILADARSAGTVRRLARCKGREEYMPFAPSVLAEEAGKFFNLENYDYSYMTIAAQVTNTTLELVPMAAHTDGTSRIQVVSESDNPRYHELLRRYFEETGIPLLLNTSFNRRGEPIVETPLDAIKSFRLMELDGLVLGDLLITKKDRLAQIRPQERLTNMQSREYDLSRFTLGELVRQISTDYPGIDVAPRAEFGLYFEYWDWITTGRKVTTVRYRPNAIDIPLYTRLPVVLSRTGRRAAQGTPAVGEVTVTSMQIKHFGCLTQEDAKRDGFPYSNELKVALQRFYGPIEDDDLVTVYHISLDTSTSLHA